MRLEGKTALITGASRNIGKATALAFAREGADLILNTRTQQEELDAVAAKCGALGVRTQTILADVADADQVFAMVEQGLDTFGKIVATSGQRTVEGRVEVEVLQEIPAGRGQEGIPEPELVHLPGAAWRSRMEGGRWQVNTGHRDYSAIADRPALPRKILNCPARRLR